jgi:hypothetical protein
MLPRQEDDYKVKKNSIRIFIDDATMTTKMNAICNE